MSACTILQFGYEGCWSSSEECQVSILVEGSRFFLNTHLKEVTDNCWLGLELLTFVFISMENKAMNMFKLGNSCNYLNTTKIWSHFSLSSICNVDQSPTIQESKFLSTLPNRPQLPHLLLTSWPRHSSDLLAAGHLLPRCWHCRLLIHPLALFDTSLIPGTHPRSPSNAPVLCPWSHASSSLWFESEPSFQRKTKVAKDCGR